MTGFRAALWWVPWRLPAVSAATASTGHELTRRVGADQADKLAQSLSNATVDLNPYQVDAALFAFRSPLSRGAILADEVGLGKTIEAGIITSQLWAEHKRRILVIAPASLRKQWSRELVEKFFIPYELMHKKWQYYLLTMLRQHAHHPCIAQEIDRGWKDYPKGSVAYLQPGNVPPGGQGLAQYLAKYVVSPPISVRRIEQYDGTTVRYWYEDHQTQAIQHETLPVLRFIGLVLA